MNPDEGSKILVLIPFLFITLSLVLVLLEAWILEYFVAYKRFMTAFGNAFIVNVASTFVGFLIIDWINQSISRILILWVITVIIEGTLLILLNKNIIKKKLVVATIMMNVVSYLLLFGIILLSNIL